MEQARTNIRMQGFVLGIGMVLMAIKFLAWQITGSAAILSDALESIVNVLAGGFALYSLVLVAKPRDREHPYGHGKVEFISAGIEGGLVVMAGLAIMVQAVAAFLEGNVVHELATGILLTALAGGINLAMGLLLVRRGRKHHSITMEASGTHLLSDAWSTVAMLAGLLLIKVTGLTWIDSLFALGFGVFLLSQGARVVRRAVAGIMDETDMVVAAQVVAILQEHRRPEWIDVHNLRVIKFGPVLHIDCHATLPWYFTLEQAHAQMDAMEHLVNARMERSVELFIHMDPCRPTSCSVCSMPACAQRQQPLQQVVVWDLEATLRNARHGSPP
jgi:cation diffusion facilitator family transporter